MRVSAESVCGPPAPDRGSREKFEKFCTGYASGEVNMEAANSSRSGLPLPEPLAAFNTLSSIYPMGRRIYVGPIGALNTS